MPKSGSKASTELPSKSSRATPEVKVKATVGRSEPKQAQEKPSSIAKKSAEKAEIVAVKPRVANKASQVIPLQLTEAQTWESLPETAEVRLGPGFHTPILQLIRRGTQLQVVGRKGDWLKLQLRNGRTGWIYHSLAQPERELVEKPLNVLRGSEVIIEPFSVKKNVMQNSNSADEVVSSMQNGSEVALVYPD